jgi:hypothetical protein
LREGAPVIDVVEGKSGHPLSSRDIVRTWWPLAGSWLLMSLEGPAMTAIIARLANPEVNLAAYGGLVFPIIVLIEAPIMMILAASTALSRDWSSYLTLRKFTHALGGSLTALQLLIVATPIYYLVVRGLIHAPDETIGPARIGLFLTIPWTWAIAYRRFGQGVLIRFGRSLWVGIGTVVRLASEAVVLALGYLVGSLSGVAIASAALSAGVLMEALFVYVTTRKPVRVELRPAPVLQQPLSMRELLRFFVPLSLTSVITMLCAPIGSAAISRLPRALDSLATWSVVNGANLLIRSPGLAFNETVVALAHRPRSFVGLRRFTIVLSVLTTAGLLVLMTPPVANLVFANILHLPPPLVLLTRRSLWFLLPMPAIAVLQSWLQGMIMNSGKTRSIFESVLLYTGVVAAILLAGVTWGALTGIYVGVGAFTAGEIARTVWLWLRSRRARSILESRDLEAAPASGNGVTA